MGLLDDLPLDILLLVVKWLGRKAWGEPAFYGLLPVASINTSLRRSLLPLLYRDLVVNFLSNRKYSTRHNAPLARSAGCSGCAQQVALLLDNHTKPGDIVEAVQDDMDAGSEAKWPNLRSYACIYHHERWEADDLFYCSRFISQFDKELPRLRCASPAACEVASSITPPA
ncbi:hypothetical protein GQ54DRAFT_96544 [Martensiomyces pterosporus]|nr:hypothetical protein GQ54DRAFT_96544 [Martensiomyces pterosporus]